MKSAHSSNSQRLKLAVSGVAFCGLVAIAATATRADRGRGSIRAADRSEPAPRAEAHAAPRAEAHGAPRAEEHEAPRGDVHEAPHAAPEVHKDVHVDVHEDVHAAPRVEPDRHVDVNVHHDWDDNDEDARHWGGFAHGAPVRIVRGQRFHDLPHHVDVLFHNVHYFLDDVGAYYVQEPDGEYETVQPPVGVIVGSLPDDVTPIAVGPTTYYYLDGIYYVQQGSAFAVVNPPPGIVVPSLPSGASQAVVNGTVVFQFQGFNYTPEVVDGVTEYVVTPS